MQGVNFRRSAAATANALGVVGWVANRADGTVTGYACGSGAALDEFSLWLGHGPDYARVERLDVEPAAIEEHAGFSIR